ncbi:amidase [Lederbergia wuyishanensis]|uniref:Aspartyl-tRNA(Asn)/glutamyl-tRNA(Gln) amidotransferase subunit A n=1 Tax=Lederbergia wuyishanensis TaxID=1347903 RepID=A0ABU0D0D1_9BACI|nr:amidase [Lederbergia wuyishanensis]MCJ8006488.1 amidase [Lederbergia wuyishanensis]MDQ0341864.1 aspartyl-tRNA(Asn)/glutamyl-tRNA(Gln) amidotransferase subunit A [Lederbergia wuyishanensis]
MENLSIRSLIEGFRKKQLSPVEITRLYLDRIHHLQDLNAYITVTENVALQQAEIAEKKYLANEALGVLEGIPLSYKDNLDTKGIRTTSGSKIDENYIPNKDAGVVYTLQREGAINLGKVNMHEFAFGITSNNPFYGSVKNPWNNDYTPGGSSGGSGVAVAASLSVASIGTDTAGSIRIPAASCGVVGLKPTHGLVDASGVKHISWTLDHIGPLTRNMDDLAIMMDAMTGKNYTKYLKEDIRGLRIGVPKNYFNEGIDQNTALLYKKALEDLESLGAILIEIDIPYTIEDLALSFAIGLSEAGYVHEESILSALDSFGLDVKMSLENSHSIPAIDYIKALKRKTQLTVEFEQIFEKVDVIATPTTPITPQKIGEEMVTINDIQDSVFNTMIRLPAVFNLTGHPALSIPCGLAENGLPVGLQFAAAKHKEKVLIHVGYAYEQAFLRSFYEKRNRLADLAIESK